MSRITPSLEQAAARIAEGGVVAFSGAGISVESGIPDFRSGGGLWERFDPMDHATIDAFRAAPARVWAMFREVHRVLSRSEPNPAHHSLMELERAGVVQGVVTQNIDNLHQRAGSRRVVDYHGNAQLLHCLWCGARYPGSHPADEDGVPYCACGRPLKPTVVLFGEIIPREARERAEALAASARTVLVVGTSGLVEPAASLPVMAREAGASVIEVNLEPSALTDGVTDIFLPGRASEVLSALQGEVARLGVRSRD
ncbi:MAG: NAD-dependent deacylase [Deltaproteobacteria bacterium]|nr:MAG: NAD-dependent deacylase [Deltaproteobacteria bacterium]